SFGGRSRIIELVRESGGKLSEGSQSVALLLDTRGLANAVGHQSDQARGQFRHSLYELRKLRRREAQQSAIAHRPAGHRRFLHPRKGEDAGYFACFDREGKGLSIDFAARLEFAFEDDEHVFGRIALPNVCFPCPKDLLLG